MSLTKLSLCVLLFGLTACGNKSNSNNSPSPVTTQDNKAQDTATDYNQTANLNLSQTYDDLQNIKSNSVSLKGTGTKSTYKVIYNFNTAGNASFKVIETSLESHYSDCSEPQLELTLKGKNSSRKISILDQVNVDPNSDYSLEVVAVNRSCKELEMNLDVVAWMGSSLIDPKVASICDSNQVGQTTFVMNVNFVTAFSSVVGKEKFLGMESYCGEDFHGASTQCTGKMNLFLPSQGSSYSNVSCVAEKNSEKRSYSVDFNSADKTATVVCKKNDTETFSETLKSCHSGIVDYKKYSQPF